MHGLWDPLLPRRMPAGQSHPRVERPGLPRRVGRGRRTAACHQQFPRVHRPTLPRTVRRGLRARYRRRPGEHRADRVRDRGTSLVRRTGVAGPRERADRQAGGGGRIRSVGIGCGPAARPGRSPGGGVRAGREARRPPPLRDPRVQDGKGGARSPSRAAGGRRGRVPLPGLGRGERARGRRRDRGRCVGDKRACGRRRVRRGVAGRRSDHAAATYRLPGGSSPACTSPWST